MSEPTLQSLQEQLNRIERILLGTTVNPDDFAPGGCEWMKNATIAEIKEFNKQSGRKKKIIKTDLSALFVRPLFPPFGDVFLWLASWLVSFYKGGGSDGLP